MIKLLFFASIIIVSLCFSDDGTLRSKYQIRLQHNNTSLVFPQKDDIIRVHYVGRFPSGYVYDSSLDRNLPFEFRVGRGQVIVCWEEVIPRMAIGDKLSMLCPSKYAYGEEGWANIPKNQDIIFDVERLSLEEEL